MLIIGGGGCCWLERVDFVVWVCAFYCFAVLQYDVNVKLNNACKRAGFWHVGFILRFTSFYSTTCLSSEKKRVAVASFQTFSQCVFSGCVWGCGVGVGRSDVNVPVALYMQLMLCSNCNSNGLIIVKVIVKLVIKLMFILKTIIS